MGKRDKIVERVVIGLLWAVSVMLVLTWMHSQSLREDDLYPLRQAQSKPLVGVIR